IATKCGKLSKTVREAFLVKIMKTQCISIDIVICCINSMPYGGSICFNGTATGTSTIKIGIVIFDFFESEKFKPQYF
ncbi:MAG: hypothetical protein KAS17_03620, partial [Victivallaceae bacterium]|nr:hypothetical protein [Victivallaceae bacterium]